MIGLLESAAVGLHSRAFAQNGGAGDAAVGFVHAGERLVEKRGKPLKLFDLGLWIRGQHGLSEADLKPRVRFFLARGFLRERSKFFAAVERLPFPEEDQRFQIFDVKFIHGVLRHGDGALVFLARRSEIAHQRARIAQSILRADVDRVDLQSGMVVFEGALIIANFAQDFAERILRIGGGGLHFCIAF